MTNELGFFVVPLHHLKRCSLSGFNFSAEVLKPPCFGPFHLLLTLKNKLPALYFCKVKINFFHIFQTCFITVKIRGVAKS